MLSALLQRADPSALLRPSPSRDPLPPPPPATPPPAPPQHTGPPPPPPEQAQHVRPGDHENQTLPESLLLSFFERRTIESAALYKTRMCNYLLLFSVCPYGDECTFAHSPAELRPRPRLHKTALCRYTDPATLSRAACPRRHCTYAHSLAELQVDPRYRSVFAGSSVSGPGCAEGLAGANDHTPDSAHSSVALSCRSIKRLDPRLFVVSCTHCGKFTPLQGSGIVRPSGAAPAPA